MQHVNLKVFAKSAQGVNLADAIPVFHRWIQRRELPELLIDVADYSHVPAGPGVLLIGHEANYSLDFGRNRLGLLYNRKAAGLSGGELGLAYERALDACRRLEREPEFLGELLFDTGKLEVTFNDRLLHPNTDEGWREVQPELERFFDGIFGRDQYALTRVGAPRERLRASVTDETARADR